MDERDESEVVSTENLQWSIQATPLSDSLALRVKSLERELSFLTRVSRNTQEALKEALDMAAALRQDNANISEALTAANGETARLAQTAAARQRSICFAFI